MAVVKVYDRAADSWIPVQDTDVNDMVSSGKYGLESGIDVPVTMKDGQLANVPSDHFERGVKAGDFRWSTDADKQANEAAQLEANNRQHFGNAAEAGVLGALRGATLGLSDPAMIAMGGLTGHGADVQQALGQEREQSPWASGIGELAGAVASAPMTAGAGLAERAGARGVEALIGGSKVSQVVQGIAKGAGSAVAGGAFYGLGSGISEAALGNPDEIAQHLAAGPAMGALFGGAFGSAFGGAKAAAPYFRSAVDYTTSKAAALTGSMARKTIGAYVQATMSATGEAELAKVAGDLAGQPEVRAAYMSGGAEKVKSLVAETDAMEKTLTKRAETLKSDLDGAIQGLPKHLQNQIQTDLTASVGDLGGLLDTQLARVEDGKSALYGAMKADTEQAFMFPEIHSDTEAVIKKLEATKDVRARAVAKEIQARLKGEISARGIVLQDGEQTVGNYTHGNESIFTRELREKARLGLENEKMPEAARDILKSYQSNMDYVLKNNSKFGEDFGRLEEMEKSLNRVRQFATGALAKGDANVKTGIIKSILGDPRKARDFDQVFSNISKYMPEFEAYRTAGSNAVQRMNAVREASSKFEMFRDPAFDRGLTLDDFQKVFDSFAGAPKNIGSKITDLRMIQDQLAGADGGTVSKYVRIAKFMGQDVSPEIAKLAPFEKGFADLDKLAARGTPSATDPSHSFISRMAADRIVRKVTGKIAGAVVGATVGGLVGDTAGLLAGAAIGGGFGPSNTLRTLTKIEAASQKSFKMLSMAIDGVVSALTSSGTQRLGTAAAGTFGADYKKRPLPEARKDFKERSAYIDKLSTDPHYLMAETQRRTEGLEAAPNVATSLASQFSNTASFLASKVPKDPLASKGLSIHHSLWQPSDMELSRFERYVDAAEHPARVIADIGKGEFSPEAVETLKALQPAAFTRLQQKTADAIMDPDLKLNYSQKMMIGQVLEVRADSTLDPQFIVNMQATFLPSAGAPATQGQGPANIKPSKLNLDPESTQTDTQRIST
jgi:hypothetical protein